MKIAIVYSSRTGNTKMIAEAVREVMPEGAVLCSVEDAPDPAEFDLLARGFWVDKGQADKAMDKMNDRNDARSKAREMGNKAEEKYNQVKNRANEEYTKARDNVKQGVQKAEHRAEEGVDRMKHRTEEWKDKW